MSFLEQLRQTFRLADAIDVFLVSLFLYALFTWVRSSASRPILVGMGFLSVVYVAARAFDMYMTAAIFQAGLAFGAVAVIVVFQEDLRRAFIRLASLGNLSLTRTESATADLDVLVETAFELAKKRVGALLVLRGTEPLDRHLRGGVITDARISKGLLDSIFDPHSMGHDGAVIIDENRIAQFAAHLPLSENSEEIGSRGTRHTAALGLSEVSDAFVIVVSEERGEVSVAEAGELRRIETPIGLKQRLDHFTKRAQPQEVTQLRRRFLVENSGLKAAALLVACIAWFLISFESETVQKTFVAPIEYRNLAETMDIDDSAPTEVRLTLTGFERAFNLLVPTTLKVSFDMTKVAEGQQEIVIDESNVRLPSNLSLFRSAPRIVSFGVHTWVKASVTVDLRTEGRLPRHLRGREILVTPQTVQVQVWRSRKDSTTRIDTELIDLSKVTDDVPFEAKFVVPQYLKLESDQPSAAKVTLQDIAVKDEALKVVPKKP